MKKFLMMIVLAFLSSCAISNPPSGPGVFYTDMKELIYYDPDVLVNREASVCSKNYLGIVSLGDNGLNSIRVRAGIGRIASIERTYYSAFLTYAKSCLVVRGQGYH